MESLYPVGQIRAKTLLTCRHNMKQILYKSALLIGIFCITAIDSPADTNNNYFFNFPKNSTRWKIMFPCQNAGNVYLYTPTALDIMNMICDGKPVVPEIFPVTERTNYVTGNADGRTIIYQSNPGFCYCWNNLEDKPGHQELRLFRIPKSVKSISVKYRIRFPNGSVSSESSVCFQVSEEEDELLMLPNSSYPTKPSTSQQ